MSVYQSFLTALGWSLLESIWQMGILWLIYYIFTIGNFRISSAGKHNLILVFVFIGAEWFIYTLLQIMQEPVKPAGAGFIPVSSAFNYLVDCFSLVYLAVIVFRVFQYLIQPRVFGMKLHFQVDSLELQSFADRNSRILGITRKVQVYMSDIVETAQTSGFLKPLILLPLSMVSSLSPRQIEAILIHELFHIRRNDYVINICMSCFRSIFFFNPFALLFYKELERERELACDDGVLEMGFAPDQYAEALFRLEKFRQIQPGFYLAADGNKPWLLMERICRLLGKPTIKKRRFNSVLFFSLIISVLLFGLKIVKTIPANKVVNKTASVTAVKSEQVAFERIHIDDIEKAKVAEHLRHVKSAKSRKPKLAVLSGYSEPETYLDNEPEVKTYFADDYAVKNFSNQEADIPGHAIVISSPKVPYVPPVTLSYQAVPEIKWQDSINEVVMQDGFRDLKNLYQIKSIAKLEQLQSELEKNSEQLREIEIKNKNQILIDRKLVKPILDKIHRQMKLNKLKVDQLKLRLVTVEAEIIHI